MLLLMTLLDIGVDNMVQWQRIHRSLFLHSLKVSIDYCVPAFFLFMLPTVIIAIQKKK